MTFPFRSDTAPNGSLTGREREDFTFFAELAEDVAGLCLPLEKAPMVKARLLRRQRALGLSSLSEYCNLLRNDPGPNEINEFISVLTTNVTAFYREHHHFDYLREHILPNLINSARAGHRIRLWSAGCSTGEEPYTLAMEVLAQCPEANALDLRILATDVDRGVLATGQKGTYPADALAEIIDRHGANLSVRPADVTGYLKIAPTVRSLVSFRHLNLIDPWPLRGPFQVIFCRNVLIYFRQETQAALWPKFKDVMAKGGHLFLGHSERIETPASFGAQPVASTTYKFY